MRRSERAGSNGVGDRFGRRLGGRGGQREDCAANGSQGESRNHAPGQTTSYVSGNRERLQSHGPPSQDSMQPACQTQLGGSPVRRPREYTPGRRGFKFPPPRSAIIFPPPFTGEGREGVPLEWLTCLSRRTPIFSGPDGFELR